MALSSTIASSLDLGHSVLGQLSDVTALHQKRVEQAGFAVLKSPDIPSILVETGFISNRGDCRRLMDNSGNLPLQGRDKVLAGVILDMALSSTIASSLDLGHSVLGQLSDVTALHQKRVEQAGFAVLKSPDIPSILVETGFISNRGDCRRLMDERHRPRLAEAIFAEGQAPVARIGLGPASSARRVVAAQPGVVAAGGDAVVVAQPIHAGQNGTQVGAFRRAGAGKKALRLCRRSEQQEGQAVKAEDAAHRWIPG